MQQHVRNVDLDRAHLATRAAQRRSERKIFRSFASNQLRGQKGSDRSGIDPSIGMAADLLINRTGVQTGAAANAIERLAQVFVCKNVHAAVIEYDYMKLLGAFVDSRCLYPAYERNIGAHLLTARAPRQQPEKYREIFQPRDDFLDPHQRHMNAGERGGQSNIALVFDEHDRSGLRHCEVSPGDAETRGRELLS